MVRIQICNYVFKTNPTWHNIIKNGAKHHLKFSPHVSANFDNLQGNNLYIFEAKFPFHIEV